MIGILLFALLQQPAPASSDVELQVALKVYQGERVTASATTGNNDTLAGSVWTDSTFCGVGSGNTSWSVSDRIRWQFTGRIVQSTSTGYTVEIDWQRDGGSYGALPKTTRQLVLQIGAPQVLDTLTPTGPTVCAATSLRIEAAVVPVALDRRLFGARATGGGGRGRGTGAPTAAAGGGGRGGAAAGGFGGGGSVAGGGARGGGGARAGGSAGTQVNGAGANAAGGRGGRGDYFSLRGDALSALDFARMLAAGDTFNWNFVPPRGGGGGGASTNVYSGGGRGVVVAPMWLTRDRLTPIATGSYDAELWLMHTPPGGTEETQHLAMHFGGDGDAVAFPSVPVSSATGATTVDVAVALRVMADEKGASVLRVIIVRRVGGSSGASTGATTKVIPLPAASDTVSFELPDARGYSIDALTDHRFSVRVRLGSGK